MGSRPLIQHTAYIDLPGEPVECWADTELKVVLRKHRDVVFDIKLGTGATYTVTTDRGDSKHGRFYDPKRKLNVTKATFADGELCHLWLGRTFEGSLILSQGTKEVGRYPIKRMDGTKGCTEDPKDKPAPVLIVLRDDKAFVKNLLTLADLPELKQQPVSPVLSKALDRARAGQSGLSASPFGEKAVSAEVVKHQFGRLDEPKGALLTIHAFKIKQTSGPQVPQAVLEFFASGAEAYHFDPLQTISRNFILAQIAGSLAYMSDTVWNGPLKGFWKRAFIIQRNFNGGYTLLFSTSTTETRMVGYLLGVYKTTSDDIKVMTIAGGFGSLSSTARASWEAANAAVSPATMTGKSLLFAIAMDSAAWLHDYQEIGKDGKPKKDLADLFSAICIDSAQMWLTTATVTSLVSGGFMVATELGTATIGAPIVALAIGTMALLVIASYFIAVPFNLAHASDRLAELIRSTGHWLENRLPNDYSDAYANSSWQLSAIEALP